MNWEMFAGLIRHLLTFGGGFLMAKGLVDEATMNVIISGAVALVGVIWSGYIKKTA